MNTDVNCERHNVHSDVKAIKFDIRMVQAIIFYVLWWSLFARRCVWQPYEAEWLWSSGSTLLGHSQLTSITQLPPGLLDWGWSQKTTAIVRLLRFAIVLSGGASVLPYVGVLSSPPPHSFHQDFWAGNGLIKPQQWSGSCPLQWCWAVLPFFCCDLYIWCTCLSVT